jgi:hypothetical protein
MPPQERGVTRALLARLAESMLRRQRELMVRDSVRRVMHRHAG